jgi:hypothetical protein
VAAHYAKIVNHVQSPSTTIFLGVLALAAVVHGIPVTHLGLYWDDPELLMQPYQALDYQPLMFVLADTFDSLRSERPVSYLVFAVVRAAFVHSMAMVHWVIVALFALTAITLARISRLLVAHPWFHFATAVTFLLHPLGSVHAIWPSTAHYFAASLFAFGTILAAVRAEQATDRRRWVWLGLATVSYAACVLTHEVFALIPLSFLWAYFLLGGSSSRGQEGKQRLLHIARSLVVCTAPLVITLGAYAVWRLAVLPTYGGPLYPATDIVSHPGAITLKVLRGVVTTMFPWTHVLAFIWFAKPSSVWVLVSVAVAAAIWAITMMFIRPAKPHCPPWGELVDTDDWPYWRAALIGLAMVVAATVSIAVAPVHLRPVFGATIGSRGNLVAIPGIALLIPALILIMARLAWRWVSVVPAFLLGGVLSASLLTFPRHRALLSETLLCPMVFWSHSPTRQFLIIGYATLLALLAVSVLIAIVLHVRSGWARQSSSLPRPAPRALEAHFVAAALAGLVLVASLLHVSAKKTFLIEWTQHKALLEGLRSQAPQLRDDTFVVIVNQDPTRAAGSTTVPFADHGELSSYMLALYDNRSIMANVHTNMRFFHDGFTSLSYGDPARWFAPGTRGPTRTHATASLGRLDYDRVVIFRWDGQSMAPLPRLAVTIESGESLIVKSNTERVVTSAVPVTTRIWRHIAR